MRRLALVPLLLLAACERLPAPGEPKLTRQTQASGLPMTPEQRSVRFIHADLAIAVQPERHAIEGVATLTFTATRPLDRMVVDLDPNLPVRSVAVDGREVAPGGWSNPLGRLAVRLPRRVPANGRFALRVAYGGHPHVAVKAPWDGGFVWATAPDGQPWVATAVEGEGCDLFWPCIDHPLGEPAAVDLHVTVPKPLAAPENGVLTGIVDHGATRTWSWHVRQPNTYAIALDVGPFGLLHGNYRSRFGNLIPLQLWYLKGHEAQARGLYAEFGPTLDFYESVIGPYPFGGEKLGVVETPHKGMEHQTINAYGNDYAKDIAGYDWLFEHELAHEWFGNQMTNVDWDDFWLHEAYAEYMQPLYGEWRSGTYEYLGELREMTKRFLNRRPIVSGRTRTEADVYDDATGPGIDIYMKGAWVLHSLRNLIGDRAFFEITRRAVYGRPDPRPGNFRPRYISTADYVRIAESVTGRRLGWFFDVYLRSAKLPDLALRRVGDRLDLWWRTEGGRPFPMPVEVQVGDRIERVDMAHGHAGLSVPAGARIVVDPLAKILRRSPDIEAYRVWKDAEDAKKKAD